MKLPQNSLLALRFLTLRLLAFGAVVSVVACSKQPSQESISPSESEPSAFLAEHWRRPLPEQGEPPESYSAREKSLLPKDCGECHVTQYQDWQGSLHSKAMGPGLMGQLLDFEPTDSASQQDCLHCHAPLAEQSIALREQLVAVSLGAFDIDSIGKPGKPLHEQGLTCAACHLRGYKIYGPPRNPGLPPPDSSQLGSHNYFTEEADFESSDFCGACHQFEDDGHRINGKLMENTYQEWKESRYAGEGVTCQKCHMPERRHLWLGIHDPETTRNGVTIEAGDPLLMSDTVSATLTLINSNTGHNFPTYVTPKIYLQAYQIDENGDIVDETFQQETIGWEVSSTLTEEKFDTRLAPDESHSLHYSAYRNPKSVDLVLQVMVDPDNFYRSFYEAKLRGGYTNLGAEQILKAYQASQQSFYPLYEIVRRIDN
jgi:Cytochrome c554 and c-prime